MHAEVNYIIMLEITKSYDIFTLLDTLIIRLTFGLFYYRTRSFMNYSNAINLWQTPSLFFDPWDTVPSWRLCRVNENKFILFLKRKIASIFSKISLQFAKFSTPNIHRFQNHHASHYYHVSRTFRGRENWSRFLLRCEVFFVTIIWWKNE